MEFLYAYSPLEGPVAPLPKGNIFMQVHWYRRTIRNNALLCLAKCHLTLGPNSLPALMAASDKRLANTVEPNIIICVAG